MRDLLCILNPRNIRECMESYRELDIDRLWISRMWEYDIAMRWDEVLEASAGYDRLVFVSDDGIVRPHALAAVRGLLDAGIPVATGYSNLSAEDFRVNLTKQRVTDPFPTEQSYSLYTLKEVMEHPHERVPTFFTGMCLTGMSRDLWAKYPFMVYGGHPGWASDYALSKRLGDDRVKMVAHREAFVWHVKERWNNLDREPRKRVLNDKEPASIRLEVVTK